MNFFDPLQMLTTVYVCVCVYIYIYIYIYIYCGGRSKRQTQWVWRQASERLLFNRNNKIVSKGKKVSKRNRGSGVLVVLRGS